MSVATSKFALVFILTVVAAVFATPDRARANCSKMGVKLTISGKIGKVDRDAKQSPILWHIVVRDQSSGGCKVRFLQVEDPMPAGCTRGSTFHASGSFFIEVLLVDNITCP
jgi:hypothetical protein